MLATKQKITEHAIALSYKKLQAISQTAANARSILHRKLQQFRSSGTRPPVAVSVTADKKADNVAYSAENLKESVSVTTDRKVDNGAYSAEELKQSVSGTVLTDLTGSCSQSTMLAIEIVFHNCKIDFTN